jgi:hypothetical protein
VIQTIPETKEAREWEPNAEETAIYADASYRKGKAGTGIYQPSMQGSQEYRASITIGQNPDLKPTHVESLALESAFKHVITMKGYSTTGTEAPKTYVIASKVRQLSSVSLTPKAKADRNRHGRFTKR